MRQLDLFTQKESRFENRYISIPQFNSPSDLETFLADLSIVDVGLHLKSGHFQRQGSNYRGLCLFHNERTPSLYLKPRGNWFVCYGCHEAGGPLNFVYKVDRRLIVEISQKCGLPREADPFEVYHDDALFLLYKDHIFLSFSVLLRKSEKGLKDSG